MSLIIKFLKHPSFVPISTPLQCLLCRRLQLSTASLSNTRHPTSRLKPKQQNHMIYFAAVQQHEQMSHFCLSNQEVFKSNNNINIFNSKQDNVDNVFLLNGGGSGLSRGKITVKDTCRCYHSCSRFSLSNSLYDSYLQSLLSELKQFENETDQSAHQIIDETKRQEQIGRLKFLQASAKAIQELYERLGEIQELETLMQSEEDDEMKSLMEKEINSLKANMAEAEEEVIDILVGDDPADNNGVILEVSAGVGGQEAMLFCAEVFQMYWNYSIANQWDVTILSKDEVGLGGFRKASIEISGPDVYKYLKHEAGVHRVQRIPKTEKSGRIHTSTISVSVLPQPREVDIQIDKQDLKIETFRGSGPGGQSVNTTDSAVRITHVPSGIVAECRQERSQIKNKDIAMGRLKLRMYEIQIEKEEAHRRATRKMQMGTRGRSEKIRTYNFQQDRVTDHRVKENQSNLAEFMLGGDDLDNMISKVAQEYKYQTLESMLDEFETTLRKQKK